MLQLLSLIARQYIVVGLNINDKMESWFKRVIGARSKLKILHIYYVEVKIFEVISFLPFL